VWVYKPEAGLEILSAQPIHNQVNQHSLTYAYTTIHFKGTKINMPEFGGKGIG